jgi:2-polyprenyl-3-methyl-5-hydroxy-6-metoxy-1,4-benzoquinol methylase
MKKSNRTYNQLYFTERDHLDLHIANSIRLICEQHELKSILDVGCGTGRLVKFLRNFKLDARGCDISVEAVKLARLYNRKNLITHCSATKLNYYEKSFDLVTAVSVIEHLDQQEGEEFIKEVDRILKNNGWLFLITPNYNSPLRLILQKHWFGYSDPTHKHFYTPQSLSRLCKKYGFSNIKFRFPIDPKVTFNWHLPLPCRSFPQPLQTMLTWIMISSPLSTVRDSFWIAAQKEKK